MPSIVLLGPWYIFTPKSWTEGVFGGGWRCVFTRVTPNRKSFSKEELGPEDLPREILDEGMVEMPVLHVGGDGFSLDEVLANYEQRMLYQALEHAGWVKTRAAELLKIKRTTLIEKMKRLGIPLKAGVPAEPVVAALAEGTDASGVRR